MTARPARLITVAGSGSNSGKTTLVCDLLRRISTTRRVGALKIATATADHRCARSGLPCSCLEFEGPSRLSREPGRAERAGKDTWRMRQAGADPVWFLQTTVDSAEEASRRVVAEMVDPPLWIVEGAAPLRCGLADLGIVVASGDGREPKAGWLELVSRADAVLFNTWTGDAGVQALEQRCRASGLRPGALLASWEGGAGSEAPPALIDLVERRVGGVRERDPRPRE
jgi:hypothetical protein